MRRILVRRGVLIAAVVACLLAGTFVADAAAQSYPLPPLPPDPPVTPEPPSVVAPPRLMSPFPIVRIVGRLTRDGVRISLLSVRAPTNATIDVTCFRRGCRKRSVAKGRGINRAIRFRRFQRSLRAGTIIEIRVRREGTIGKITRFRIHRGRRPARSDRCLRPGSTRGSACPDA